VSRTDDGKTIVAYLPEAIPVRLFNLDQKIFDGQWFNPKTNQIAKAKIETKKGILEIIPPSGSEDLVLVLKRRK
jgi:hypothetical protein